VDVGGVISVLRGAGFRVDGGILGVNQECTAAAAYQSTAGKGEAFVVLRLRGGQAATKELLIEGRPVAVYLSDRED